MRIGELARLSGLTASRIRFYEAAGLILAVERQANGYRDYPPEAVWILEIIASAQIEFLQPGGSTSSRAAATAVELQFAL